jgi:uridine kinase
MTPARATVLAEIASLLANVCPQQRPARVAVDGPDTAGKTTLANELVPLLHERGRAVARVSIDGFHRSREERQRRGSLSAEGYYRDSFDLTAFREAVLAPLGVGGDRMIRRRTFDLRTNRPCSEARVQVEVDAVVIVDGVFLLRPELREFWDASVYVEASEDESVRRALVRDADLFGSEVELRYRQRYLPGQRLYRGEADPLAVATVVVDNEDPETPVLRRFAA